MSRHGVCLDCGNVVEECECSDSLPPPSSPTGRQPAEPNNPELAEIDRLHAETDFWRERAEQAEGALERMRAVVEAARIAAQQLDEVLGRGALASVLDALDALDREEVSR